MKNNLMAALLAVVAFAGLNLCADNKETTVNVKGGIKIVNKTGTSIFVRSYALVKSCLGGCDYNRIENGKSFTPKGSLLAGRDNLVIYVPVTDSNGNTINKEKEFEAKTGEVTVTVDGSDINVADTGTTTAISIKTNRK